MRAFIIQQSKKVIAGNNNRVVPYFIKVEPHGRQLL